MEKKQRVGCDSAELPARGRPKKRIEMPNSYKNIGIINSQNFVNKDRNNNSLFNGDFRNLKFQSTNYNFQNTHNNPILSNQNFHYNYTSGPPSFSMDRYNGNLDQSNSHSYDMKGGMDYMTGYNPSLDADYMLDMDFGTNYGTEMTSLESQTAEIHDMPDFGSGNQDSHFEPIYSLSNTQLSNDVNMGQKALHAQIPDMSNVIYSHFTALSHSTGQNDDQASHGLGLGETLNNCDMNTKQSKNNNGLNQRKSQNSHGLSSGETLPSHNFNSVGSPNCLNLNMVDSHSNQNSNSVESQKSNHLNSSSSQDSISTNQELYPSIDNTSPGECQKSPDNFASQTISVPRNSNHSHRNQSVDMSNTGLNKYHQESSLQLSNNTKKDDPDSEKNRLENIRSKEQQKDNQRESEISSFNTAEAEFRINDLSKSTDHYFSNHDNNPNGNKDILSEKFNTSNGIYSLDTNSNNQNYLDHADKHQKTFNKSKDSQASHKSQYSDPYVSGLDTPQSFYNTSFTTADQSSLDFENNRVDSVTINRISDQNNSGSCLRYAENSYGQQNVSNKLMEGNFVQQNLSNDQSALKNPSYTPNDSYNQLNMFSSDDPFSPELSDPFQPEMPNEFLNSGIFFTHNSPTDTHFTSKNDQNPQGNLSNTNGAIYNSNSIFSNINNHPAINSNLTNQETTNSCKTNQFSTNNNNNSFLSNQKSQNHAEPPCRINTTGLFQNMYTTNSDKPDPIPNNEDNSTKQNISSRANQPPDKLTNIGPNSNRGMCSTAEFAKNRNNLAFNIKNTAPGNNQNLRTSMSFKNAEIQGFSVQNHGNSNGNSSNNSFSNHDTGSIHSNGNSNNNNFDRSNNSFSNHDTGLIHSNGNSNNNNFDRSNNSFSNLNPKQFQNIQSFNRCTEPSSGFSSNIANFNNNQNRNNGFQGIKFNDNGNRRPGNSSMLYDAEKIQNVRSLSKNIQNKDMQQMKFFNQGMQNGYPSNLNMLSHQNEGSLERNPAHLGSMGHDANNIMNPHPFSNRSISQPLMTDSHIFQNFDDIGNLHNMSNSLNNMVLGPGSTRESLHPDLFMTNNPWVHRKKRKSNPLAWQYMQQRDSQAIVHPSKYSSIDYINTTKRSKMLIGTYRQTNEKPATNYTVLPLFLNHASAYDSQVSEFLKISKIFLRKSESIDYENVTVQQLKVIMKMFGLNHTGKKVDLIVRMKQTVDALRVKIDECSKVCENTGNSEDTPSKIGKATNSDSAGSQNMGVNLDFGSIQQISALGISAMDRSFLNATDSSRYNINSSNGTISTMKSNQNGSKDTPNTFGSSNIQIEFEPPYEDPNNLDYLFF